MAAQQFEYKIILLGEAGVGKTSIFTRIKTGRFNPDETTDFGTQGTDVHVFLTTVGDDSLSVALWDTAGGERFRTLTNNFYRNADGVLLVYSVEDLYTFDNLQGWINDASQHDIATCEWALIGNKNDLHSEIEKSRIEKFCEAYPTKLFFSTSAKTGENVLKAFKNLIFAIHRKHVKHSSPRLLPKNTVVDTVHVGATTVGKQKRKDSNCCS